MTTFGVHSEIGQLRQAIVHRPGLEIVDAVVDKDLGDVDAIVAGKAGTIVTPSGTYP